MDGGFAPTRQELQDYFSSTSGHELGDQAAAFASFADRLSSPRFWTQLAVANGCVEFAVEGLRRPVARISHAGLPV